jgi:hypothetical protein
MEREVEYLRQQCEYLERMLEHCLACISSLETRVAELERRPVLLSLPDEPEKGGRGGGSGEEELSVFKLSVWEMPDPRRRAG